MDTKKDKTLPLQERSTPVPEQGDPSVPHEHHVGDSPMLKPNGDSTVTKEHPVEEEPECT